MDPVQFLEQPMSCAVECSHKMKRKWGGEGWGWGERVVSHLAVPSLLCWGSLMGSSLLPFKVCQRGPEPSLPHPLHSWNSCRQHSLVYPRVSWKPHSFVGRFRGCQVSTLSEGTFPSGSLLTLCMLSMCNKLVGDVCLVFFVKYWSTSSIWNLLFQVPSPKWLLKHRIENSFVYSAGGKLLVERRYQMHI